MSRETCARCNGLGGKPIGGGRSSGVCTYCNGCGFVGGDAPTPAEIELATLREKLRAETDASESLRCRIDRMDLHHGQDASAWCAERDTLRARLAEVQKHRDEERDGRLAFFLAWRDIEDPCPKCGGCGTRAYANSTGWRGGAGGQMVTSGVCDSCWGTGDSIRKGADLRRYEARLAAAELVVEAARAVPYSEHPEYEELSVAFAAYYAARGGK